MALKRCGTKNEGWTCDDNTCYVGDNARRQAMKSVMPHMAKDMTSLSHFNANRTLFMFDDFYQESAQAMVEGLMKLDAESNDPINIVINSYGGSVYSLFSILDTMSNLNSQVNTICLGEADSCGAILLAAGDARFIGKNSRSMIHEVSTFAWGKISEIAKEIADVQTLNDKFVGILAQHTGQDHAALAETMKKDTFLTAEETLKMGLVDGILDAKDLVDALGFTAQDKQLVASARSRTKDAIFTDILFNKAQKGGEMTKPMNIIDQVKNLINKGFNTKGDEEPMLSKEEMVVALKEQGIDVEASLAQVTDLSAKLESVEAQLVSANEAVEATKAELDTFKKDAEKNQIEDLLNSLISEGKSSQNLNDTIYRDHFNAVGLEKAKEVAAVLPVIVKLEASSVSNPDVVDEQLTDAAKEDLEIQAIAKEKNLNYSDAEKEHKRLARENKKGE